jgi:hypothetical protein
MTGRPSAVVDRRCAETQGVKICAINRLGRNIPQLEVTYSGYLTTPEYGGVVAWVSLNGMTGFFHMKPNEDKSSYQIWLGRPASETPCLIDDQTPSRDSLQTPSCPPDVPGRPGDLGWIVVGPPDQEAILFAALLDAEGLRQPWKIEAAFVSVDGRRWDSKYGVNYQFGFEIPTRNR